MNGPLKYLSGVSLLSGLLAGYGEKHDGIKSFLKFWVQVCESFRISDPLLDS